VIALLRTEWSKALRRPRTYVAIGFVMAIPVIVAFALWANPPDPGRGGGQFFYVATQTGLLFPAAILRVVSRLVLLVVIALFAGDAIAGEANTGNLRYLLLRPIPRGRLLAAKLTVAASLALVTTIALMLTATIAGGVAFGFTGLHGQAFFVDQSAGNLLLHTAMATGYVTWSLASVVAFGFMVSTMTDSPGGATAAAVGLGITSQILEAIDSLGSIRNYLPLKYFDAWTGLFWSNRVPDDVYSGLLLPIPFVLVFCGVAWWWFRRKDVLA
jgi:ABC-2 type transport system permease protein